MTVRRGNRPILAGVLNTDEQRTAVRERDVTAVGAQAAVLGAEAGDHKLGADLDRVSGDAAALQRVGRAALDHPGLFLAVRPGHLHVDPRMGVDPLDLGDRALQGDGGLGVEFSRKRMVGQDLAADHQQGGQQDSLEAWGPGLWQVQQGSNLLTGGG